MQDSIKQSLAEYKIQYVLHTHRAVFTVPEAKLYSGHIPGTHCKNLVLKNKKTSQLYLVTIPYDKKLDLNQFKRIISAPKIRFADDQELSKVLGITAGAVSPLALLNDKDKKVIFMIEESIWNAEVVCCHPNINTETLQIPGSDFRRLIIATGTKFQVKELPYIENGI
jgi:Ala-tRNA(Pro) deacylase